MKRTGNYVKAAAVARMSFARIFGPLFELTEKTVMNGNFDPGPILPPQFRPEGEPLEKDYEPGQGNDKSGDDSKSGHGSNGRRNYGQIYKGVGLAAILVALMLWLAGSLRSKVQPNEPFAPLRVERVETVKVERMELPLLIDQVGTVRSRTEAQVSARIMAQIRDVRVREGEDVCGAGSKDCSPTVLAVLDDRDIQARIRQAESQVVAMENAGRAAVAKVQAAKSQASASRATLQKALADFKRYEGLEKSRAATGQQLDHARAQRDIAQAGAAASEQDASAAQKEVERIKAQKEQADAALAEARVLQSFATIYAPFSGKVLRKLVNVGDMASPGQPLFYVEIAAQPELHAVVSESLIAHLRVGQELPVEVGSLGREFHGTIREIVPAADPSTRTIEVKASLPPDPSLVNGLFGRMRVRRGSYEALIIPAGAVSETGQLYLVQVADREGRLHRRFITPGERHGLMIEVLSGLKAGEEVAVPWTGK